MDITQLGTSTTELLGAKLDRLQRFALGMLVVGLALTVVGAIMDPAGVFHSYLFAYLFWAGVTIGSLALLMLHHTVGGGWGYLIRGFLEAATRLLPFVLLLFVPVLLGMTA